MNGFFQRGDLPVQERELLARASSWPGDRELGRLTAARLLEITESEGIGFATALLHDRVLRSPLHAPLLRQLEAWNDGAALRSPGADALSDFELLIVPGAFYREYPHTGADGRLMIEAARHSGIPYEVIPVGSRGRVDENAHCILSFLARSRAERIVLASVCKGSADLLRAFELDRSGRAFERVGAWIDLSGVASGTPMVAWYGERPVRRLLLSSSLRLRGFDPRFLSDLSREPDGARRVARLVPAHVELIHVLGFPLERHCTNSMSRRWWKRLSAWGPNDGATLLGDVVAQPGSVVPVWGADHYMRPSMDVGRLAAAVLALACDELGATRSLSEASLRKAVTA